MDLPKIEFKELMSHINLVKSDMETRLKEAKLSLDDFNKQIVQLAYELAINGYPEDCLLMLMDVKGDYFNNAAIAQFKIDQKYFEKATLIFEVLSFMGKVEYDVLATQRGGKA